MMQSTMNVKAQLSFTSRRKPEIAQFIPRSNRRLMWNSVTLLVHIKLQVKTTGYLQAWCFSRSFMYARFISDISNFPSTSYPTYRSSLVCDTICVVQILVHVFETTDKHFSATVYSATLIRATGFNATLQCHAFQYMSVPHYSVPDL